MNSVEADEPVRSEKTIDPVTELDVAESVKAGNSADEASSSGIQNVSDAAVTD